MLGYVHLFDSFVHLFKYFIHLFDYFVGADLALAEVGVRADARGRVPAVVEIAVSHITEAVPSLMKSTSFMRCHRQEFNWEPFECETNASSTWSATSLWQNPA